MRSFRPRHPCRFQPLLALLAWLAIGVVPESVPASTPEVLVISGNQNAAHDEAVVSLQAALASAVGQRLRLRSRTLAESSPFVAGAPLPALVVTVGTEAAARVLEERPGIPVYSVFVPEAAYLALQRNGQRRAEDSALYVDQPIARRLRLISLALPRASRIGVVLGPDSRRQEAALRRAAVAAGFSLHVETITEERQLIGALHRLLEESDILLAVPDALVFNRHTVQSVLLTANGRGKPVAGYSRAYVQAGALLAVYSTPGQIGRQAGESLRRYLDSGHLPAPQGPRYFSVIVNERVAHSLELDVPDEATLAEQLRQKEAASETLP